MSFLIHIPENAKLLKKSGQSDPESLLRKIHASSNRSLVFHEEQITGFVVHTFSGKDTENSPEVLELEVKTSGDKSPAVNGANDTHTNISLDLEYPVFDVYKTFLHTRLDTEIEEAGQTQKVSIWEFTVLLSAPKHESGGTVVFTVKSGDNLQTKEDQKSLEKNGHSEEEDALSFSENLLEGLNFRIGDNGQRDYVLTRKKMAIDSEDETITEIKQNGAPNLLNFASLTVPIALPLILKLKLTKPGGRNDVLLSTLSIESSPELNQFSVGNLPVVVQIEKLEAQFRSGTISALGHLDIPRKCSTEDMLNITYKIVNNEIETKNQISQKPLKLDLGVKIQKLDELTETYVDVSDTISTLWLPLLEFGHLAPPISNTLKSATNTFQLQTQFNPVKEQPRKLANPAVSVSKSRNSLLPPRVSSPGRQIPSAGSLPLLGGRSAFPKKAYKSMVALPTNSSSVTVNLGNSNSSLSGLLLTFKGNLSVELGQVVTWSVQAINQSGRSMNLCLSVKTVRKRNSMYLQGNSSSGFSAPSNVHVSDDSESQVVPKLQLFGQYNLLKLDKKGVIILSNNVRLGVLEPNNVFETELQFIGISKGIFNLDGLRIIDLATGDGMDFGKLVEVFVM